VIFSRLFFGLYLLAFVFTVRSADSATVTTLPATGLSLGSATLNATATLSGSSATFGYFEYGTTTNYGSSTGQQLLGSSPGNVNFNQPLTGLASNQIYHFRADIIVLNSGTVLGTDRTFIIPGPPLAVTGTATSIHPGQAVLNATTNPNNTNSATTSYWFQHGTNTSYGNITPAATIPGGTVSTAVSNLVTGLPRGGTYHFRSVASNIFGQSFGADVSFNLLQGPTAPGGSTGGGQSFDARQPALELNFLICTNGNFPQRDGGGLFLPFISEICLFAGNFEPAGWAFCHGQSLAISKNTAVYSLIGTTYGGDASNFNLPNLRGYRALDSGQGLGLSSWNAGVVPYNPNLTSSSTQETLSLQNLPAHAHTLPAPDTLTGTNGGGQPRGNLQLSLALNYEMAVAVEAPGQGSNIISEPFLGQIFLQAPSYSVDSLIFLNGTNLSINSNSALFDVIGTNYGGDGMPTFNVPDLRSRVPIGTGQGQMSAWSLGQQYGFETVTITQSQMPAHQHTVPSLGIVTGFTGSNQPQSLMQPSLVLKYLICTNGQIPSATVSTYNQMLGEIQIFAGTNQLNGWAVCDGSLLPVAGFTGLFSVISNWYGGDGITTFALPDLRGRVPVGSVNAQPGTAYGAEQVVLTQANLPAHTHTGPVLDFDRWITSFGLNGTAASFSADADGDQVSNGYEWATGSNPTNAPSFNRLVISSTRTNVLIGFSRNTNATDSIFTLQRSTNLANPGAWIGIATNSAGVWTSSAIVTESSSTNPVNVTVSTPLTNTSAANYRLQINWP